MANGEGQAAQAPARGAPSASRASRSFPMAGRSSPDCSCSSCIAGIRRGQPGRRQRRPAPAAPACRRRRPGDRAGLPAGRAGRPGPPGAGGRTARRNATRARAAGQWPSSWSRSSCIAFANVAGHGQYLQRLLAPTARPASEASGSARQASSPGRASGQSQLPAVRPGRGGDPGRDRRRRDLRQPRCTYATRGGGLAEPGGDESEDLRKAVESGRSALRTLDDARAAIIACYVAMEASLARPERPGP